MEWKNVREVAGDEGLAHALAVRGDGDEELKAIGKAGEDPAHVLDQRGGVEFEPNGSVENPSLPESVGLEVVEGVFRGVFVVVPADEEEACGEAVAECLAPWDAVGCGLAFVQQIEHREQEQRLVRPFVAIPADTDDAGVEVVEAGDGGVEVQVLSFKFQAGHP